MDTLDLKSKDIVSILENVIPISEPSMSKYVHGERPLTTEVFHGLHNFFFINPKYLNGETEEMFDIPETFFHSLPLILKGISIGKNCEKKGESVLLAKMDSRIYECILNQRKIKNFSKEEGCENAQELIKTCMKELKKCAPAYEEYFIIPRKSLVEIAHDNEGKKNDFCPLNLDELLSTILTPPTDED